MKNFIFEIKVEANNLIQTSDEELNEKIEKVKKLITISKKIDMHTDDIVSFHFKFARHI